MLIMNTLNWLIQLPQRCDPLRVGPQPHAKINIILCLDESDGAALACWYRFIRNSNIFFTHYKSYRTIISINPEFHHYEKATLPGCRF